MRRISPYHQRREIAIEMTPMIDVVFLLLVFFVYAASDAVIENLLPTSLSQTAGSAPSATAAPLPEADFDNVVVRILYQGGAPAWQVNGQPLPDLPAVGRQLEAIAAINRAAPVILHPDPAAPLGDVIDVYDLARLAGFEKVQFTAAK